MIKLFYSIKLPGSKYGKGFFLFWGIILASTKFMYILLQFPIIFMYLTEYT